VRGLKSSRWFGALLVSSSRTPRRVVLPARPYFSESRIKLNIRPTILVIAGYIAGFQLWEVESCSLTLVKGREMCEL